MEKGLTHHVGRVDRVDRRLPWFGINGRLQCDQRHHYKCHKSLAQQFMPALNAFAPGPVHTPLQPEAACARRRAWWGLAKGMGLDRSGQPSEIAPSFIFLASAEASLYTGRVYPLGD